MAVDIAAAADLRQAQGRAGNLGPALRGRVVYLEFAVRLGAAVAGAPVAERMAVSTARRVPHTPRERCAAEAAARAV